jgi:2-methylcitrate dehydratase
MKFPAVAGEMAVDNFRVKRYPIEGNAQAMIHQVMPPLKKFYNNVDEIASVNIEIPDLGEIASPECWDPSNRETADHSLPYLVAVALTDEGKSTSMPSRPSATCTTHDWGRCCSGSRVRRPKNSRSRWTVRKKSGEVFTHVVEREIPLQYPEVLAKFDKICAYMKVPEDQRDRAKATWTNFKGVKDIADAMALLAHFGPPLSLTERAPYASDVLGWPRKA